MQGPCTINNAIKSTRKKKKRESEEEKVGLMEDCGEIHKGQTRGNSKGRGGTYPCMENKGTVALVPAQRTTFVK